MIFDFVPHLSFDLFLARAYDKYETACMCPDEFGHWRLHGRLGFPGKRAFALGSWGSWANAVGPSVSIHIKRLV